MKQCLYIRHHPRAQDVNIWVACSDTGTASLDKLKEMHAKEIALSYCQQTTLLEILHLGSEEDGHPRLVLPQAALALTSATAPMGAMKKCPEGSVYASTIWKDTQCKTQTLYPTRNRSCVGTGEPTLNVERHTSKRLAPCYPATCKET